MSDPRTVAVVTGANTGIGRAVALHLAGQQMSVYATVRARDKAAKLLAQADDLGVTVHLVELDVADDTSVHDGFAHVLVDAGRVDVLVNNAGIGGNGVVEEATIADYAAVMDVNVFGAIRCLKAVLPGMRARRSGTIVNISSVAGRFAAIAQAPYVTSKWALEGMSEQLAHEVAQFGIRVAIIEPGITKSSIFGKNTGGTEPGSDYEPHLRRMFRYYQVGHAHATDAVEVAVVVHHAITTDDPRLRYTMSWSGPEIATTRAALPDEEWVALGAIVDDDEYYRAFRDLFGVDITAAALPDRDR